MDTGLADGWTINVLDTDKAFPAAPRAWPSTGRSAVVIADGGDALAHLATLRDQDKLLRTFASGASAWRCVERIDEANGSPGRWPSRLSW